MGWRLPAYKSQTKPTTSSIFDAGINNELCGRQYLQCRYHRGHLHMPRSSSIIPHDTIKANVKTPHVYTCIHVGIDYEGSCFIVDTICGFLNFPFLDNLYFSTAPLKTILPCLSLSRVSFCLLTVPFPHTLYIQKVHRSHRENHGVMEKQINCNVTLSCISLMQRIFAPITTAILSWHA